jgi:small subunit ribosomal protein S8
MTDTIADMLTRIRNAQMVNHRTVEIPYSNVKFEVAKQLKSKKFISAVEKIEEGKFPVIRIVLIKDRIKGIQRVSSPGQRIYKGANELDTRFKNGRGVVIVSTSKGILDSREARQRKLGGEVVCRVW